MGGAVGAGIPRVGVAEGSAVGGGGGGMPAYSALSASLCVSSSYGMISAQCLPHHPCMRCLLAAGFHEGVSGSPSWSGRSHVIEPYTNFCMYLIAVFIRRFTGMDFSDQRWWHFFHSVSVMAMLRLIASAVEPSVLWRTPRTTWSFWAIFILSLCCSTAVAVLFGSTSLASSNKSARPAHPAIH